MSIMAPQQYASSFFVDCDSTITDAVRVYLDSTSGKAKAADATTLGDGVIIRPQGGKGTLLPFNMNGTITMIASEAITKYATVYAAADGKVASSGTIPVGKAIGAAVSGNQVSVLISITGGTSYTLPTASDSVLGCIKVGSGLTITDGVLSVTGG